MNKERLEDHLSYLRLPTIRSCHPKQAATAERDNLSYLDFLERLIDEEVLVKKERAAQIRLRKAKFPVTKTLEQFDFHHPKKIAQKRILSLFDLCFIENRRNVLFVGQPGVGKTHLALALGYHACQKGYATLFSTAAGIINTLNASLSDNSFLETMKKYLKPKLLIIDELGFLPIDKRGSDLLFQVLSARYETGSVVITTNRPPNEWAKTFNNDTTLAAALADRILHHCEVVIIEGVSYRIAKR
ncbi:MAG: IS21-like element helper ATPase IstB [Planctomycetota bacterium]|jgi:DNA replication protein DnaC